MSISKVQNMGPTLRVHNLHRGKSNKSKQLHKQSRKQWLHKVQMPLYTWPTAPALGLLPWELHELWPTLHHFHCCTAISFMAACEDLLCTVPMGCKESTCSLHHGLLLGCRELLLNRVMLLLCGTAYKRDFVGKCTIFRLLASEFLQVATLLYSTTYIHHLCAPTFFLSFSPSIRHSAALRWVNGSYCTASSRLLCGRIFHMLAFNGNQISFPILKLS